MRWTAIRNMRNRNRLRHQFGRRPTIPIPHVPTELLMNTRQRRRTLLDFVCAIPILFLGALITSSLPLPGWGRIAFGLGWIALADIVFAIQLTLISSEVRARVFFFMGGLLLISITLLLTRSNY